MLQIEQATKSIEQLGFCNKGIDEIKGIFSDTNVYLLCFTVFVGGIHVLFDFLSFKNDALFWRRKRIKVAYQCVQQFRVHSVKP